MNSEREHDAAGPTDAEAPEGAPTADEGASEAAPEEDGVGSASEERAWTPWHSLADFQETVGELVDSALRNVSPAASRYPRYDLIELPGTGYRLLFDLPGLEKDAVELKTAGGELTVGGERPRPRHPEGAEVHRSERPYGRFQRVVRLPGGVDAGGITARMTNGVLEVSLPLRAAGADQTIDIE